MITVSASRSLSNVMANGTPDGESSRMSSSIDSLSMMTIVVNAEEKFGVRIPDEEVKNLKTVGDAVEYIKANATK